MSTTNITLEEAITARTQKHNEATALLSQIQTAQSAICEHQQQINKISPAASYYKPVAHYHASQIEKLVERRNEAICRYDRLMWLIYSSALPIFSTTAIQEVAKTLYTVQQTAMLA